MPAPMEAELGWGIIYEIGDALEATTYEEFGRVMDIDHADPIADDVDVTHMRSPNRTREYIQGLTDPGEFSITMFWEPGSDADDQLHALKASGAVRPHRLRFIANEHARTVNGYIKSLKPGTPIDDKSTLVVTVKLSGDIVRTNGAGPPPPTPSVYLNEIEAANPVSAIRTILSIEKLDAASYVEFAVTQAIDAGGINLARWWEGSDRTNPDQRAPSYGLASLAKLYDADTLPAFGATGAAGITAAVPTDTQDFGDAVSTTTWNGTSSGGATGFQSTDPAATVTYTVDVVAGGRITVESVSTFVQGAVPKVVVRNGGTEIAAANYTAWLVGTDRVIDQKSPGEALGVYPVAKDLPAGTYTVELSFVDGLNPDGRRLFATRVNAWAPIAFDADGPHVSILATNEAGQINDRVFESGGVLVYEMIDVTRVAWLYRGLANCGTVNFAVYNDAGVAQTLQVSTLDMSAAAGFQEITVARDLPAGDYYLHVELDNIDIAKPRLYTQGAIAYNEGLPGGDTDKIDILSMPVRPTGGSDIGNHIIAGPPALDVALHVKRPEDATFEWVGSVHGSETDQAGFQSEVSNADLRVFVDDVQLDWAGAAQFDKFYGNAEIRLEFDTFFQVPADTSLTFATVTRTVRYLPGGIVKHSLRRVHTLDMECDVDFSLNMLQVPNPNTTTDYSDDVGGGYTQLDMSESGGQVIGTYNGASSDQTNYADLNPEARFRNGEWEFVCAMDNPDWVRQQYAELTDAVLGSRVLNYPSGFVKFYSEAANPAGFLIPAGFTVEIDRTFRISPDVS